jgi:hypothetical protein
MSVRGLALVPRLGVDFATVGALCGPVRLALLAGLKVRLDAERESPCSGSALATSVIRSTACLARLSRLRQRKLHEAPDDYFRYTRYGLDHLLTGAGFHVVEIVAAGSIFSFLRHQVSTFLLTSTYRIPVVRELAFLLNGSMAVPRRYWLDPLAGLRRNVPAGYVAVALKE